MPGHIERPKFWFKKHQKTACQKRNMGSGHILLQINEMAHITLIDLRRERIVPTLVSSVHMGHY